MYHSATRAKIVFAEYISWAAEAVAGHAVEFIARFTKRFGSRLDGVKRQPACRRHILDRAHIRTGGVQIDHAVKACVLERIETIERRFAAREQAVLHLRVDSGVRSRCCRRLRLYRCAQKARRRVASVAMTNRPAAGLGRAHQGRYLLAQVREQVRVYVWGARQMTAARTRSAPAVQTVRAKWARPPVEAASSFEARRGGTVAVGYPARSSGSIGDDSRLL